MAKSGRQESVAEFQARMRSISVMQRTPKVKEKIIVRDDNGADKGKRAKVVHEKNDGSAAITTTSDNRQDVNIMPDTHYQTVDFLPSN
jgi:hypothetical protein